MVIKGSKRCIDYYPFFSILACCMLPSPTCLWIMTRDYHYQDYLADLCLDL